MKIVGNSLVMVSTLAMSLGLYGSVLALEAGVSAETSVSVTRTSDKSEDGVYSKSTTTTEVRTTSETKSDNDGRVYTSSRADSSVNANSTTTVRVSDDHRSRVSIFVQNLLNTANRSASIGAEVRAIAREQDDSSTSTVESMNKVEARNAFKTFLIGSDYKNIGTIRSALAKTDNHIARLSVLASSTTSAQLKAELTAEIRLLQDDQVKVKAFVDAHENAFSLFGWFVKIFVR